MRNTRSSNVVTVADNLFDKIQARNGLAITNGSQFANIAGMISLEAETRELEGKTAKLNRRVEALTNLERDLGEVNATLASVYMCERPVQKKMLRSALEKLNAYERVPVGAAAPLRKAKNELVSMREAVHTLSAATKKKSEFSLVSCLEAHGEIGRLLKAAQESLQQVDKPEHNATEVNATEMDDILKKTRSHQLPPMNKSGYALGRAPVIPNLNVSAEKLTRLGFRADHSSGYTVVHDQLVLGISKKFMDEHKLKQYAAAQKLTEMLGKHLSKSPTKDSQGKPAKLILVSKHPAAATNLRGVAWYWVMREKEWNNFARASGKVGDLKWGLAF